MGHEAVGYFPLSLSQHGGSASGCGTVNNGICSIFDVQFLNAIACQSVRPITRPKKSNEVYLNAADGLEGKTLVKCDFVLVFHKSQAIEKRGKRGEVCPQRIAEIRKKLQEHF